MKYDVTALGELLIDLTQKGINEHGNPVLEANPGGAPCNVLACLSKLGHRTAFIGKVGRDSFGEQLLTAIEENGIDSQGLCWDEYIHTTLAVIHTQQDGDREFSFYRNPGADMMLTTNEVPEVLIQNSCILHYGSVSMTDEPSRSATYKAIEIAEKAGILRSFDPNLRPPLWKNLDQARVQIEYGLSHCDILKISDNEILWISGKDNFEDAVQWLRKNYSIPMVFLTLGKEGSRAYCADAYAEEKGYQVNTVDTTGAGDTFMGAILHQILMNGWRGYSRGELKQMLHFANAAAAIVTTKTGALRAMPSPRAIYELMESEETKNVCKCTCVEF